MRILMDLTPVGVVLAMSWIQMNAHVLVRNVAYYHLQHLKHYILTL